VKQLIKLRTNKVCCPRYNVGDFFSAILADGGKYLRMAENTCGWRKILADGEKYLRMTENTCGWQEIFAEGGKYLRMARNTCGRRKILAEGGKYLRISIKIAAEFESAAANTILL
jgi:hypothetical protein